MVVYITIGNTDDKLTQPEWAQFVSDVGAAVSRVAGLPGGAMHGAWTSGNHLPWQNACWCLEMPAVYAHVEMLKSRMGQLARRYGQDSIAWAESETQFITPAGDDQ
jgi:hypothetical protein